MLIKCHKKSLFYNGRTELLTYQQFDKFYFNSKRKNTNSTKKALKNQCLFCY